MIAILVKDPFGYEGYWARHDIAPLSGPDVEGGTTADVKDYLDETRQIFRRTKPALASRVSFAFAGPILAELPAFDRDGGGEFLNETDNWHFGSLLMDAFLNNRLVEILCYQTGATRGVAYVGKIVGPARLQLIGDYDIAEAHREPGGNIEYEQEVELVPLAYGVCADVAGAGVLDYTFLAGDTNVYEAEET